MKIEYLGHASFLLTTEQGTRIVTDPYPQDILAHPVVDCEVVTVSHGHHDHCQLSGVSGQPIVMDGMIPMATRDVNIRCIPCWHDDAQGKKRGENRIYVIEADGFYVAHFGDLGHPLGDGLLKALGHIDAALVPAGGVYTLDAAGAAEAVRALEPVCCIPMHTQLPGHAMKELAPQEAFLALFDDGEVAAPADALTLPAAHRICPLIPRRA